jgi:hypothetical protein
MKSAILITLVPTSPAPMSLIVPNTAPTVPKIGVNVFLALKIPNAKTDLRVATSSAKITAANLPVPLTLIVPTLGIPTALLVKVKLSDFAANARPLMIVSSVYPVLKELALNNLVALIVIVLILPFLVATTGLTNLLNMSPVYAMQQPLSALKIPRVKPA